MPKLQLEASQIITCVKMKCSETEEPQIQISQHPHHRTHTTILTQQETIKIPGYNVRCKTLFT